MSAAHCRRDRARWWPRFNARCVPSSFRNCEIQAGGPPCGRGHQISVGHRLVHRHGDIGATGKRDLRGRTPGGGATASFEHLCRGEKLRAMADGRNRFVGFEKCRTIAITRASRRRYSAAARYEQCVVRGGDDIVEAGIEGEVVAALLGIGSGRPRSRCIAVAMESRILPGHTAWTVCPTAMSVWKGTIVS